jgi:hypothetical protein
MFVYPWGSCNKKENINSFTSKVGFILSIVPDTVLGLQYKFCKSSLMGNMCIVLALGLECAQVFGNFW